MSKLPDTKSNIINRYNELGSLLYDLRYSEEQLLKYNYIIDEVYNYRLILDNGCGTGLMFPYLNCIVGLDVSSRLLEKAKERCKENQYLVMGDSESLPFRNQVFDSVISVTVLQNLVHPKQLSMESSRVAKVNSPIIISSLKRVYSKNDIINLIDTNMLTIKNIFTDEKINDWIIFSTRK